MRMTKNYKLLNSSKICSSCRKGPVSSTNKPNSQHKTKKVIYANLQSRRINGQDKFICTECLRNIRKDLANKS